MDYPDDLEDSAIEDTTDYDAECPDCHLPCTQADLNEFGRCFSCHFNDLEDELN